MLFRSGGKRSNSETYPPFTGQNGEEYEMNVFEDWRQRVNSKWIKKIKFQLIET